MNTKPPECWANDPQARAVRVELSPNRSLLLPHDQFAFSELKNEGNAQELRLVFATHEVTLYGNSLRRIEMALQRMELSFIGKLPGDCRATLADGQPLVREIAVVPLEQNRNDGLEAAIGEDGPSDNHRS